MSARPWTGWYGGDPSGTRRGRDSPLLIVPGGRRARARAGGVRTRLPRHLVRAARSLCRSRHAPARLPRESGGAGPRGSGDPAAFDLGGTDCSDGLARCFSGSVAVSVAGHIPRSCTAPKELPGACACAWSPAGTCAAGCVKEGLEVEAAREVAVEQLCATPELVLRPPLPAESAAITICAEEGVGVCRRRRSRVRRSRPAGPPGGRLRERLRERRRPRAGGRSDR